MTEIQQEKDKEREKERERGDKLSWAEGVSE